MFPYLFQHYLISYHISPSYILYSSPHLKTLQIICFSSLYSIMLLLLIMLHRYTVVQVYTPYNAPHSKHRSSIVFFLMKYSICQLINFFFLHKAIFVITILDFIYFVQLLSFDIVLPPKLQFFI